MENTIHKFKGSIKSENGIYHDFIIKNLFENCIYYLCNQAIKIKTYDNISLHPVTCKNCLKILKKDSV